MRSNASKEPTGYNLVSMYPNTKPAAGKFKSHITDPKSF